MLETINLFLREMKDYDINDFYDIFSSDEVGKFVNKMTYEQVERYFEKRKSKPVNPYSFAVVLKENNKMIGTIGIKEKEPNIGELSYVFNVNYWGKGYCSECVKLLLNKAFNEWGFYKIKADCREDNLASKKIFKKFGFKFIEKISDKFIDNNSGECINFEYYSIENKEFNV